MKKIHWKVTLALVLLSVNGFGQKNSAGKYPSLFWEITGNGLKKPSYLFGTMHVSSKMAFHLSDSFYYAIKNVDAVALELNPDLWQGQMVDMDNMKSNYTSFNHDFGEDYLTEGSFRIDKYEDELKAALSTEPTVVNSLLYRNYQSKEDFEEETFLDLYIFQTGRKLGKRAAGVENYYETEKLVMQAYTDMANEKKKKTYDPDDESLGDIQEKIQNAYRRGDLDLMDSLDILTEESAAFQEKFLYRRNEIQANSIDTILKKSSVFVGVGAAHLPGNRGVIELLRKKGYKLRPIKMPDHDAAQKESIDKLKVPITFSNIKSEDGFYSVDVPGQLYKMSDENQLIDRRQYADMSNGSYYMVTRVKTFSSFIGQSEETVMKKVDSLLFENIPGKILSKKNITRNGYEGYDITNKTRRGDIQRYNIFITPYEILLFKMSGTEEYVSGTEASRFFSSIQLKEATNTGVTFSPKQGGFSVKFPQWPSENLNTDNADYIKRWEYEAVDKATGDDYLVFKKSIYNFSFLEEDTFDLKLIEESFRSPDFFDKQLERNLSSFNGYPCLDVKEKLKDSSVITARYIIKGPHYYVIAVRSKNPYKNFSDYINSFRFTPYQYKAPVNYMDTFLHFLVTTPVAPVIDPSYRDAVEKMRNSRQHEDYSNDFSYWQKERYAWFHNDSTGEAVGVMVQPYPQYFYGEDSAHFLKNQLSDYFEKNDLLLYSNDSFHLNNGAWGYKFTLRDTGSSRTINRMAIIKDNYYYSIVTLSDTLSNNADDLTGTFFKTFEPEQKKLGGPLFENRVDSFFNDLFSTDSSRHKNAQQAIDYVYFGEKDVPKVLNAINRLKPSDKDYYAVKEKLIEQLGYIRDTTKAVVVNELKKIYAQTADTATFQNAVLTALSKHKTADAVALFKELILQDPPVFDNSEDYSNFFNEMDDTLELASPLYPDILQLTALDDYKQPVTSLLVTLVDSGDVKTNQYESYFSKIYFDAKIELKKQQNKDQKKKEETKDDDDNNDNSRISYFRSSDDDHDDELDNYAILLMPFYDTNPSVPKFFDKLLKSSDEELQLNTTCLLLKNNKAVNDSILSALAASDQYRSRLYYRLEALKRLDRFPLKYKTQLDIARSDLMSDKSYDKLDSIVFISKEPATYLGDKGVVYFFKYRVKKEDDWKIGICGIQPDSLDKICSDDKITSMTDKKLKDDEPELDQFRKQLKKLLFASHKSARNFYDSDDNDYRFKALTDYGN